MSTGQPHGDRRQIYAATHDAPPPSALNYVVPGSLPADAVYPAQRAAALRLIFGAIISATAAVLFIRCFKFAVLSFEVYILVAAMWALSLLGKALFASTLFVRTDSASRRDTTVAFSIPVFLLLTVAIALTDLPIVCLLILVASLDAAKKIGRSLFEYTVLYLANQPEFHPETSRKWMSAAALLGRRIRIPTYRVESQLSDADRRQHRLAVKTFNRVRWFNLSFAFGCVLSVGTVLTFDLPYPTKQMLMLAGIAAYLLLIGVIRNAAWPGSFGILANTFCRWLTHVDLPDNSPTFMARTSSFTTGRQILVLHLVLALVAGIQPFACYFPATLITRETERWQAVEPHLLKTTDLTLDQALNGGPLGWLPYCAYGLLRGDSYFFLTLLLSIALSLLVPFLFGVLILWVYIGPSLAAANTILSGDSYEHGHQPPAVR